MQQEQADYSRKWYVMVAVAMGIFLSTIDGSIVNVALPTISQELVTEFAIVQWVVLAYLLTVTTLMLSIGRLGDMIGKKLIYSSGFVVFTLGSLGSGLSRTIEILVAFRVVQAVGAAMMMALGMAIVTEAFPSQERGRALGIVGAIVSIGIVLGPVLGGLILAVLSWHWIFFVNLPVGIAGTWAVLHYVPAHKPPGGQRFDLPGALVLFASLMALLMGLSLGQIEGFSQPYILVLFAVWLLLMVAFVVFEQRTDHPMIQLSLFRNTLFDINLITGFVTFVCTAGTIILMPFYLEDVLGYSPTAVGFLLAVVPVAVGIVAPFSGALSDRIGTRPITVTGLAVLLGGFFAVSTLGLETTAVGYVLRFLPVGIGLGIFQSPNNSAIMGAVPPSQSGIASGLLSITRTLGQTTGTAALAALWAGRVTSIVGRILPGGATTAPAGAQVGALAETFTAVVALVALALLLAAVGLIRERRGPERIRESGAQHGEGQAD